MTLLRSFLDGDGVPDEARAVTVVKGAATTVGAAAGGAAKAVGGAAGGAVKAVGGVATGAAGAVSALFKRGKLASGKSDNSAAEQTAEAESNESST